MFFADEKRFTIAPPLNSQNDPIYDGINKVKKDVDCRLLRTRPTFSHSVMASVGISALERTSMQFVEPGVKVNGDSYRNVLLNIVYCLKCENKVLGRILHHRFRGRPSARFVLITPPLCHPNFGVFLLHQITHVGINVSKYLKLFGREIFSKYSNLCATHS